MALESLSLAATNDIVEAAPETRQHFRNLFCVLLKGGAVGYFGCDGGVDTCIVLRTAMVKDGVMYVQAGGGVVADSDPDAEYNETMQKAAALKRAAEEAWRFG